MQLAKLIDSRGGPAIGRVVDGHIEILELKSSGFSSLQQILAAPDVRQAALRLQPTGERVSVAAAKLLPPIDAQEVWAAGVTYKRSQAARMEESETAASCYDRVYTSPRPEIFFKATPHRCSGQGQPVRIRADATWNVPEPELTLVISPAMKIVGFTIGNDMSSRDIEGDNPLYLPQAKVYNQCCGLGPWITLVDAMPEREQMAIRLEIYRAGKSVFEGSTSAGQMARSFEDLVQWLGRDNSFPNGCMLLTGTGVVPGSDFTLAAGDEVAITIAGIGTLRNPVVQG